LPNRRFEWSEYCKTLCEIDATSYHRLGLSIFDSYIQKDDFINLRLSGLEKQKVTKLEDSDYFSLANEIKDLYKKIIESAYESIQPYKRNEFKPRLVPIEKNPISTRAKRLIKSFQKPTTAPIQNRLGTTMSHSYVFYPHPITPLNTQPINRIDTQISYPQTPKHYAYLSKETREEIRDELSPRRLINQRNLKEKSKLRLYRPKEPPNKHLIINESKAHMHHTDTRNTPMDTITNSIEYVTRWENIKPDSDPVSHDGLKFERIKTLLSINIKSKSINEKMDAIKHLGLLQVGDTAVQYTLNQLLNDTQEPEILRYECAKSLVLLGFWTEKLVIYLIRYLKFGNVAIQSDLLRAIISGKNIQYVDQVNF
jgi:hypothetical protein